MDIKPYRKKKISAPKNSIEQSKKNNRIESKNPAVQKNNSIFNQKIKKRSSVKSLLNKKVTKNGGMVIAIIGFVLFLLIIALYKIKSLPQLNFYDSSSFLGVDSFSKLGDNILFLPQKLVDYLFFKLGLESFAAFRIVSVIFSVVALILFFILIKKILTLRDAILSTFLLGSSTWFITQSRMSTFENMLFLSAISALVLYYLIREDLSAKWLIALFLSLSLLLYIPGFIWMFIGLIIFKHKSFINIFTKNDLIKNITFLSVFFVALTPLIYFLLLNINLFKLWLGLTNFENISFSSFVNNIISLPKELLLTGPENSLIWLYNSPIIDAVTLLFIGCGIVALFSKKTLSNSFKSLLVFCIVVSILLTALSGSVYINMLILPLYIFLAFGINYLLNSWNSVFPLNPLAKAVALSIMVVLVGLVGFYHVFRYYQAWPKNEATRKAYSQVISGTIDIEQYNSFYLR